MNKSFFNLIIIFLLVCIAFLILIVVRQGPNKNKVYIVTSKYEVYYEYNVYNNDTIPCDTIYKRIN